MKLLTQVLSYEANRVAKEEYHLRRGKTIYRASDCVDTGTSLHGLWHLIVHIRAHHCMDIIAASAIIILYIVPLLSLFKNGIEIK